VIHLCSAGTPRLRRTRERGRGLRVALDQSQRLRRKVRHSTPQMTTMASRTAG
jgi:hypothetical protein